MGKSVIIRKEFWAPAHSPFTFQEQKNPNTGIRKFILKGMMLPFGKVSRNGVLYNKDSILEKHKDLIGRPVMYNHDIDGNALPVGHYIKSECKEDGWYYEADIDPDETKMIRKLERGDLRHVSIQLIGGKVEERFDEATGSNYTEAYVSDIIEGSIVPAPGFLDTTANFIAEAFKGKGNVLKEGKQDSAIAYIKKNADDNEPWETKITDSKGNLDWNKVFAYAKKIGWKEGLDEEELSEDMTTSTAGGAIAPAMLPKKKKEHMNDFMAEALAEKFIREIGEEEVKKLLSKGL